MDHRRPTSHATASPVGRPEAALDLEHHRAVARGRISMAAATVARVGENDLKKGDVLAIARFAAVQAAKRTSTLMPPTAVVIVEDVVVRFAPGDDYIDIEVAVDGFARSGVEIEAITGATVAALTIYDMCKSADRTMSIGPVALWERGGPSGWQREVATPPGATA